MIFIAFLLVKVIKALAMAISFLLIAVIALSPLTFFCGNYISLSSFSISLNCDLAVYAKNFFHHVAHFFLLRQMLGFFLPCIKFHRSSLYSKFLF
jgi:hypothetical protein